VNQGLEVNLKVLSNALPVRKPHRERGAVMSLIVEGEKVVLYGTRPGPHAAVIIVRMFGNLFPQKVRVGGGGPVLKIGQYDGFVVRNQGVHSAQILLVGRKTDFAEGEVRIEALRLVCLDQFDRFFWWGTT